MKRGLQAGGILALLGLSTPVLAQDSTAKNTPPNGLPGDAVEAFNTAEQDNSYVVDLAPIMSSWNTEFGIAPLAKASKTDPNFFTSLIDSQAISATVKTGQGYPSASYSFWSAPGTGINNNNALNDPGTPINSAGLLPSTQLAVAFDEFSNDGMFINANSLVTSIVNWEPDSPSRLYVRRINAAVNGTSITDDDSVFGFGIVDSDGNTHIRADDFGINGMDPITANNIYRVDALARNTAVLNIIRGAGPSDGAASTHLIAGATAAHNTPSAIPEQIAGRPVYIGGNFNTQYVFESAAGVTSTTMAHLGAATDQRGGVHFSRTVTFAGTVGTGALVGVGGAGSRRFMLWGTTGSGSVSGTFGADCPTTVTDNDDAFTFPSAGTITGFIHHTSQTAFQGGNGQVAVGSDGLGRILVATTVSNDDTAPTGGNTQGRNAIVVARFDPANPAGTLVWTLAAYCEGTGGKAILNGPGGATVATCAELGNIPGAPQGPSMSAPMIDAAGNVWFFGAVNRGGVFGTGLIRAVLTPATFSYELEEVVQVGQVVAGPNSATNYTIDFSRISDGNSIASDAPWSSGVCQQTLNNQPLAGLSNQDPRTLGGLVFSAEIIYDVNGDSMFVPVTGGGGDPNSPDQQYRAVMYVGARSNGAGNLPTTYCTGKTNSVACVPFITFTGTPSATSTGAFSIRAEDVVPSEAGFIIYSFKKSNLNFHGGKLCVKAPFVRTPAKTPKNPGGGCSGWVLTRNFNTNIQNGSDPALTAGATVFAQWRQRDPADPFGFGDTLTDGIRFTIAP